MVSVCEGGSHFGLPLTFTPESGRGLPVDSCNLRGFPCSFICACPKPAFAYIWQNNYPDTSRFELLVHQAFQLFLHLRSLNLKYIDARRLLNLILKLLLLSHQCWTKRLRSVNSFKLIRSSAKIFRLFHKDAMLPNKLMKEACLMSARCVRATAGCTLWVLSGHSIHLGYFYSLLESSSSLAGVVWDRRGIIQAMTGSELWRLAAACAERNGI